MNKQTDKVKAASLRDAYKVPGFRVLARLDSYELDRRVFVLTLARRLKKRRCAAVAARGASTSTINDGGALAILAAEIGRSISISRCAA